MTEGQKRQLKMSHICQAAIDPNVVGRRPGPTAGSIVAALAGRRFSRIAVENDISKKPKLPRTIIFHPHGLSAEIREIAAT